MEYSYRKGKKEESRVSCLKYPSFRHVPGTVKSTTCVNFSQVLLRVFFGRITCKHLAKCIGATSYTRISLIRSQEASYCPTDYCTETVNPDV